MALYELTDVQKRNLMDIIAKEKLHFDSSTRTGTVFHLMGALSEFGKLGLTSIGNSREEAQAIFDRVEAVLDKETESVLEWQAAINKLV